MEQLKNCVGVRNLTHKLSPGHLIWKARSGLAIQVNLALASGSLSTGSPAGRTLTKKGNGSMYSQAHVSASALRLPSASVAVRDRGY